MGCDIHGVFQRWDENSHQWVNVTTDWTQVRDYALFGILAGVRGDYATPISDPRGLPHDFQYSTGGGCVFIVIDDPLVKGPKRALYPADTDENGSPVYCLGDHSFTWLSGEDMLDWYLSKERGVSRQFHYFFSEVYRLMRLHGKVRLVCGFDS